MTDDVSELPQGFYSTTAVDGTTTTVAVGGCQVRLSTCNRRIDLQKDRYYIIPRRPASPFSEVTDTTINSFLSLFCCTTSDCGRPYSKTICCCCQLRVTLSHAQVLLLLVIYTGRQSIKSLWNSRQENPLPSLTSQSCSITNM